MSTIRCRRTPRLLSWSWVAFLLFVLLSPLTASAANLTGLSITPPNPTFNISDTLPLTAIGSYDDGTQLVIANAKQVSATGVNTCALITNGTIKCWGPNGSGQLGNGTTISSLIPVTVSGINTAVAVSATCAVLVDGTIKCWGSNSYGQLGNVPDVFEGYSSTPVTVSGINTAVAVSSGGGYTCAVLADGTLRCWGINYNGELGDGTNTWSSIPVTVSGINTAVAVSAGTSHACALLTDGTLRCWGDNYNGELGNGTTTNSSVPVAVSGIYTAVAVSAGRGYTCALLADGTIKCWGYGPLGNGTITTSSLPITVSGINTAVAVDTGYYHACALLSDGAARCWGYNAYGQLGNGTTTESLIPVTVSDISTAVAVSAGREHSCAVLTDGTARCWGHNDFGQMGNGTAFPAFTPVTVNGISTVETISVGKYHTCALLADGTLRCWGANYSGELGNGTTTDSWTPVTVSGINTAVAVSASDSSGNEYTCALLADGTVRCWGGNYYGPLGNGTTTDSWTPVTVSGINTAVAVSAGGGHTCALLADGTLRCWGNNFSGQIGNGTIYNTFLAPVAVSDIYTAVAVSAGAAHTCALLADGTLRCWGQNYAGELGNGTTTSSSTPVTVSGINNAVAVSAGGYYTCALLADGTLRCWGYNSYGQLGSVTPSYTSSIPVAVSGINTAVAVSAGEYHACAVLANGTARCWGMNSYGELGTGMAEYNPTPTSTLGYLPLAWSSSNPTVVSVDSTGTVKALTAGTAVITASVDGISASTTVTVLAGIGKPPVVSRVNVTAESGTLVSWTPKASDPDGNAITCRLGTPPANGTATIASNCSSGTYQSNPGFVGTDSFTYIANDGQADSHPGTVTVAVTEPQSDQACLKQYPVSQFSQTGKEGTISISFTGNITSHTNKAVKVCPGTPLKYQTSSTQGPVVCKVRNNTTRGSGSLRINDHIKCTDKPAGKDMVGFKVKSGVTK